MWRPLLARLAMLVCLAGALGAPGAGAADASAGPELVPRAVLFGNPERAQPRLSPDGRWISYLAPVDGVLNVWVAPRSAISSGRPVTQDRRRGIRQYFWARNGRQLLFLQDADGNEQFHLYAAGIEDGRQVDLTPLPGVRAELVSLSPRHPDEALVALNDRDRRYNDLYRIDLRDGRREVVERNDAGFSRYLVDLDHQVRLAVLPRSGNATELQRRDADGWTPLLTLPGEDAETSRPVGIAPGGRSFYLLDSVNRDLAALAEVDLASAQRRLLAVSDRADIAGVWLNPSTQAAEAYLVNHLRPEWTAIDPKVADDIAFLEAQFGTFNVSSRTDDDSLWVVTEIRSNAPPRYHLYEREPRVLSELFSEQPSLDSYALPSVTPLVIPARDGLPLVSYLTLPASAGRVDASGRPQNAVPLVLLVHGGPWARDSYGYSAEAQWLASRGYAVLRVNFRGSTGFGKRFVNAGNREWAAAMHDDLLDAVDWAVARRITTPQQVAIMGGSYGGYAALAALTFTATKFACGVSIVGPSNLNTLLASLPPYWETMREMFALRVGDPRTPEGRALLTQRSPLTRADRIVRPLLIGQGANDPRVKQAESDQIVAAMTRKAIPVTYVLYPDEGHGFARPENRASFYAVTESFLARCLGGAVEPVGRDFDGASLTVPAGAEFVPGLADALAEKRPPHAEIGLDLATSSPALRAGDDFFRYANDAWLRTTELPSDRSRWSMSEAVTEKAERDVHVILEELIRAPQVPGTRAAAAADYYAAFLDEAAIEAKGLAPARGALDAIDAAQSHDDIARLLARPEFGSMNRRGAAEPGLTAPISLSIQIDDRNPDRYLVAVSQGGLGLPDREYYLRIDERFMQLRAEYRQHVARMLRLAGGASVDASAEAVLALETEIARRQWPAADRRDRGRLYNLRSIAELRELAPAYPWDAMLESAGLEEAQQVIVRELTAIGPLAHLVVATPVATWRAYLRYHWLRAHAAMLPAAFETEVFGFHGRAVTGQPEIRARWRRAVAETNAAVGDAVGEAYVARHFTPQSRAQVTEIVENLRSAYAVRIAKVPWMSRETKMAALRKLSALQLKIGYPELWKDYSGLVLRRDDALGNAVRTVVFDWRRQRARLGRPTERGEWLIAPQAVNAYYYASLNEIVLPAAILQPPFFDRAADPAVNYGAIGGVIGHEISHGFDDQGARYDENGVLRSWWRQDDFTEFSALGERLAAQYGGFEPLPGLKVDGKLTLGENLGDLVGLTLALDAWRLSFGSTPSSARPGLTGEQRFFLSYAQLLRTVYREPRLRAMLMSDPHAPAMIRVNGVVRNLDAWYEAFDVQVGDALYLPPADRITIW